MRHACTTLLLALLAAGPAPAADGAGAADAVARGAYLVRAAGCKACHTAEGGPAFAGGRALETPFGTFHTPNITPDPETGIGRWSDRDFVRALREGLAPDGSHYYPAFPYTSYTGIRDEDLLAIKAYLFSLPPVRRPNRPHALPFPVSQRWLLGPWKRLFFEPGPLVDDPSRPAWWNRGRYLVRALGHCGECHSPRNLAGAMDEDRFLAGNPDGPEGEVVPNITPDRETGIGRWRVGDLVEVLRSGMLPDGDFVGGAMGEVIDEGTSHLTDADLEAIARYLLSLPPIANPEAPAGGR
ncbi:c-type cytochrome [Inmirania thermothiophila]|uniref:Mono/diheme cytochrome c family protein n=1 Tax=Inmirania thermothiophila TaxID=1750597 RepID=A0A3N1Y8R9_9GAMM|nr:cytochrome c [Inmirania thermothiophila]ROR35193.1 mono/diheme cytochrome c family protein [Inmirania thermothiophila]